MNTNKITIIGSIIIIIIIISVPTTYKVIKKHNNSLNEVVLKEIIESAKKCYAEGICLNDEITLKELYENNFLEKVSDPMTKEYYSELSYIKRVDNNFEFIVVE